MPTFADRLVRAAADDPVLAAAFLRVNHLVDRPQDLIRPDRAARVLRTGLSRRAPAPGTTSPAVGAVGPGVT